MNPCPFCGADTRINTHKRKIGKAAPTLFESSQVKCKRQSCGMSGPLWKGANSRNRAETHWNNCYFHPTMRKPQAPITEGAK